MTNIFNGKQRKASASHQTFKRVSVRMAPHLNSLCGILDYGSVQDQNLWDAEPAANGTAKSLVQPGIIIN